MAGTTLDIEELITPDNLGTYIGKQWLEWNTLRQEKVNDWNEVRRYLFATDTTKTSNSKLPWNNKTTIPKLCQIRDNLAANYMATMFPRRRWLSWEGDNEKDDSIQKSEAIKNYMSWAIDQREFKTEVSKLVLDYIDYGNCFGTVDWIDRSNPTENKIQAGYIGPVVRRISPLDIVFNPIASSFEASPKIVKSMMSMGEVKELLERHATTDAEMTENKKLFEYMKQIRSEVGAYMGDYTEKDSYYAVDGFVTFRSYLQSNTVELLTFYGDYYDTQSDTFYKNYMIVVADRHKVILKKPNPSYFGYPPIFHAGWRVRQDNLWAMGPLDNLVGMQYRIDHLENLKADCFDLIAFPPLKIKGFVNDFDWGPFARIYVGDDGDVEVLSPDVQVLQANLEIGQLEAKMEEMAGAPKEAMGFRTPGEKTKYEVQSLENAASRIFQNKINQFEEIELEPLLNGMLELAKRKIDSQTVRVIDDELQVATWYTLTAEDITGSGVIKPIAARHFSEQAQMIQNITGFWGSAIGQDPLVKAHWSTIAMSKMFEQWLEVQEYDLVIPYVRLSEEADAQKQQNVHQEGVAMTTQTPSGVNPDDVSPPDVQGP